MRRYTEVIVVYGESGAACVSARSKDHDSNAPRTRIIRRPELTDPVQAETAAVMLLEAEQAS